MVYETDPKKVGKILKGLEKQDKALEKYDTKGNLANYVSTCLEQAQNYFKIYKKEQCIEKLNQAVAYCHEHPNVDLPGKYPFQLISHSTALCTEIDKLYDFYFGLYNKIEELNNTKKIHYWHHCVFVETKEDVARKSGSIIPIPFIVAIQTTRSYSDVFSHAGWVFITDEGLSFLILPTIIMLTSSGPIVHNLEFYCSAPHFNEFNLSWSEIANAQLVGHIYMGNTTVRLQTYQTNFDIMIYSFKPFNILNFTIGDHKELGVDNLVFRPSMFPSISMTYSEKGLQKDFHKKVQSMKATQ